MQFTLPLNDPSSFSFECPKEKKQKKKAPRSKTRFRTKRANLSLQKNVLINQFEYAEFSAKTTFLKAGQPARPQCDHTNRGRPTARISVFYLKVCF